MACEVILVNTSVTSYIPIIVRSHFMIYWQVQLPENSVEQFTNVIEAILM